MKYVPLVGHECYLCNGITDIDGKCSCSVHKTISDFEEGGRIITELKSRFDIEKLAVIATPTDDGKLNVDVICKVVHEKYAYQATYNVSLELLEADNDLLAQLFSKMEKYLREVLTGEKELDVVV